MQAPTVLITTGLPCSVCPALLSCPNYSQQENNLNNNFRVSLSVNCKDYFCLHNKQILIGVCVKSISTQALCIKHGVLKTQSFESAQIFSQLTVTCALVLNHFVGICLQFWRQKHLPRSQPNSYNGVSKFSSLIVHTYRVSVKQINTTLCASPCRYEGTSYNISINN